MKHLIKFKRFRDPYLWPQELDIMINWILLLILVKLQHKITRIHERSLYGAKKKFFFQDKTAAQNTYFVKKGEEGRGGINY